VCVCVCEMTD